MTEFEHFDLERPDTISAIVSFTPVCSEIEYIPITLELKEPVKPKEEPVVKNVKLGRKNNKTSLF